MAVPEEIAEAGLRHASDSDPGIRRHRRGRGFSYHDENGAVIRDTSQRKRIESLAIPPAWEDVWICPKPNGYLQATGRDARGRKQSIYHLRWRTFRDETKFGRLSAFGRALPGLRKRIERDLRRHGVPRERVVAAVVGLLEATLIRVGNERYVLANDSYGLTTLEDRHLELGSASLRFRFRGKSGKQHEVTCRDRRLSRIVRQIQDLPGQTLFQFLDEEGECHPIGSHDVNDYLKDAMQGEFTAKDIRTWAATVEAAARLREAGECTKESLRDAVKHVAIRLGNTAAVCRSAYIHPVLLDLDNPPRWVWCEKLPRPRRWLEPMEVLVLQRLGREAARGLHIN